MRVVTFGYQTWGFRTLQALIDSDHEVVLSVTHPASEHAYKSLWSDSVEDLAKANDIDVHITERVDRETIDKVAAAAPDVIVVNSWYTWMPAELYNLPPHGTLNLHDSLLPKFAGFSPVLWAVISGHTHTGLTVHRMDEELDAGDILVQRSVEIRPTDTAPALVEMTMDLIPDVLKEALAELEAGTATWTPQDPAERTFFHKRSESDSLIDWRLPAEDLERFVRALADPYPNAYTFYRGQRLRIVDAAVAKVRYGGTAGRVFVREGDGMAVVVGPDSFRGHNLGLLIKKVRTDDGTVHVATDFLARGGFFASTVERSQR